MSDYTSPESYKQIADLREALRHSQRQLTRAKAKTENMVEAVQQAAKEAVLSMGPIAPVAAPAKDKRNRKAEVALLHITDWQGAKKTASYNLDVMRKRALQTIDKAAEFTEIQRSDHPVREAHMLLGGDMIEGLFNFPTQAHEIDATLFEQWSQVSRLLIDITRKLLTIYEKVTVTAEWGNHGRIGSMRAGVPLHDNVDRMVYEHARLILKESIKRDRLEWEDSPEDIQRVTIGNYRALLLHGDEKGRTGYGSPQAVRQHIINLRAGAYPWQFRDAYIGHFHQHQEQPLPDGLGAVYFTGSTESDNRYALLSIGSASVPTQRLHFVDPEMGHVAAQYKIWLD